MTESLRFYGDSISGNGCNELRLGQDTCRCGRRQPGISNGPSLLIPIPVNEASCFATSCSMS